MPTTIVSGFLKLGLPGALLLVLGWLVYTIITGYATKLDSLAQEVDFLANAVYSSCDVKPPPLPKKP